MKLKFEFSPDPRHINSEVMNYVIVVNVLTELFYTVLICLYSANWWASLICCFLMPALNGSMARLSGLKNKPYFYISLALSGPIVVGINSFSGAGAPGWLFGLTMIWGTVLAVRNQKIHLVLVAYTFLVTGLGMWLVGKPVSEMLTVAVVLGAMTLTLTRTFSYLNLQNGALHESRQRADSLLTNMLPV